MSEGTTTAPAPPATVRTLLTTEGRAAQPFRFRVGAAFATIAALHVLGLGLLLVGVVNGTAGAVTIGVAAFAYFRGLVHSFDFDHISMIDNSTRKFVAEGRKPASVGLAFSAGHSSVVILTGVLVIAGASIVDVALDETSGVARALGIIGLSVSGLYLLLVGIANLASFVAAWKLSGALRRDPALVLPPGALTPRGPAARLMRAPLRRVRHPRHIYVIGFLFSLGFDTSSQIALLMATGAAALAGAPALSLLALPILFAAAMTLGDTSNGLMMLKLYETADDDPIRKVRFNLLITGVSIVSALTVGVIAGATLLSEVAGVELAPVVALASVDTSYAGYLLVVFFAAVGLAAVLLWRRARAAEVTR
jgi:high-affinity nickel-transport protein